MGLKDLFELIARLPTGQYVRIGVQPCGASDCSDEPPRMMLCADVWAEPPKGGWPPTRSRE